MNDQIADMIVRIKNAGDARKESLVLPYSKMKLSIAEILQKEGFVKNVVKKGKKVINSIEITLIYEGDAPRIKGVDRISKFSRRVYQKSKDLRPVMQGQGLLVLTTPKGILTSKEARKANVGGEPLFKIW